MTDNAANESTMIPEKKKRGLSATNIPALTIMTHPEPARIGETALLRGLARGKDTELSRLTPTFKQPGATFGQGLDDPFLSREPIFLRARGNGIILLDRGQSKTELIVAGRDLDSSLQIEPDHLSRGLVLVLGDRIVLLLHICQQTTESCENSHGLIGASRQIAFLLAEIERVADLPTPVLLRGPSGTGKELAARAIHKAAGLKGNFVSVNLAALPSSLAASELFGAEKGSFTGSQRNQMGYFRMAQQGTLFLDEIGEASPEIQVMLLRALDSGEISPVGSQKPINIETRLIAATDADLEAKMAEDSFKTPLFHRLAGYEINLPSLVNRLEDFGRLFMFFARQELQQMNNLELLQPRRTKEDPWLPPHLVVELLQYSWPGNVRQLRNVVRQLVIGCRGETSLHMVPKLKQLLIKDPSAPELQLDQAERVTVKRKPASIQEHELVATLKECQWDVKAAASALGISRAALYLLIEKTPGLTKATDLTRAQIEQGLKDHQGDLNNLANDLGVSGRALRRQMTHLGM